MSSAPANIHYHLSIKSVTAHLLNIRLEIGAPEPSGQVLTLPAWIPGSYMIRDFAKNIVSFSPKDTQGKAIPCHKIDKQTWQLAAHKGPIYIEYDVYAFDLSVRSAYLDDEFAFFNGTSVFLAVQGQEDCPCTVALIKPQQKAMQDWQVATTMPLGEDTQHHKFGAYQASDYEELIDHPILLGNYDIVPFTSQGTDFELILAGGHNSDTQRMGIDLQKICQHHIDLFADTPPMQRYLFITMLSGDGFGGLEHMTSTALLYPRDKLPSIVEKHSMPEGYQRFLSLCSHEFFHSWHVKRIRAKELKQGNLQTEQYTEQLWIYEGFTSYYDDISLKRCGLISTQSYLEVMGQNLTRLLRNSGSLKQTITESSFDAWTRFYQQDASAINNIVSYYNKGAVIALCLDLLIRQASDDSQSLDDVMRLLWQYHGKVNIATEKDVIQVLLKEHMGLEFDDFFHSALYTTDALPTQSLLESFGAQLQLSARNNLTDKGGTEPKTPLINGFGAGLSPLETGVKITHVEDNTPAFAAGLQVGDSLLTLDHRLVSIERLPKMLDAYPLGQTLNLHVLRDQKMKVFEFTVQAAPKDTVFIHVSDQAKLNRWMC